MWYKTRSIYYFTVSVDQESGTCLAGWSWFRVSYEVSVKIRLELLLLSQPALPNLGSFKNRCSKHKWHFSLSHWPPALLSCLSVSPNNTHLPDRRVITWQPVQPERVEHSPGLALPCLDPKLPIPPHNDVLPCHSLGACYRAFADVHVVNVPTWPISSYLWLNNQHTKFLNS